MISVSEKAVLRVSDLLDWIDDSGHKITWDRGVVGVCHRDVDETAGDDDDVDKKKKTSSLFRPGNAEFMTDIYKEKSDIGDVASPDDLAVIVLSHSQYSRYRSVLKRVAGKEREWMNNGLIIALGGFTTLTRRTYILFCRDSFEYAELEEHPFLCNHLGIQCSGDKEVIIVFTPERL